MPQTELEKAATRRFIHTKRESVVAANTLSRRPGAPRKATGTNAQKATNGTTPT
jgi:hypothetical protein